MRDRPEPASDAATEAPSCPPAAQRAAYERTGCPVCGSFEAVPVADRTAMAREEALLRDFHRRRLESGVPAERLTDRLTFSQCAPLGLACCRICSHLYRNPSERRESLEAAYQDEGPDRRVLRDLYETQLDTCRAQVARLTALAGRPGTGLEVGSFAGGFLAAAAGAGWTFQGLDVNREAVAFARENGLEVTRGELHEVGGRAAFDAIVIWNTFEQLPDARAALSAARRLIRDGGILGLRVPNGAFYLGWRRRLDGPLHRVATTVLAHNNLLRFPYRQGFTGQSLTLLLADHRFEPIRTVGDTLVPVADAWTTAYGRLEERVVKAMLRVTCPGWKAPWVEVYARAR